MEKDLHVEGNITKSELLRDERQLRLLGAAWLVRRRGLHDYSNMPRHLHEALMALGEVIDEYPGLMLAAIEKAAQGEGAI